MSRLPPIDDEACHVWIDALAQVLIDYDSRSGAFAGLNCLSPWSLLNEVVAERCEHSISELRRAMTSMRIQKATGRVAGIDEISLYRRWVQEMQIRLQETGCRRTPLDLRHARKFSNYRVLKKHIGAFFEDLGCTKIDFGKDSREMSFRGQIMLRDSVRVDAIVRIMTVYDGSLWNSLDCTIESPKWWSSNNVSVEGMIQGGVHYMDVGMDIPPEISSPAEHTGEEFPIIDRALAVMRASVSSIVLRLQAVCEGGT